MRFSGFADWKSQWHAERLRKAQQNATRAAVELDRSLDRVEGQFGRTELTVRVRELSKRVNASRNNVTYGGRRNVAFSAIAVLGSDIALIEEFLNSGPDVLKGQNLKLVWHVKWLILRFAVFRELWI